MRGVPTVPAGEHGGVHGGPGGGHDEQEHGAQVTGHPQDHRGRHQLQGGLGAREGLYKGS